MRPQPFYRLFDADPAGRGVIETDPREAAQWNRKGWGIFATVQAFNGARRIECLDRIRAWAVDIDTGDKPDQFAAITSSPLPPSSIVETRRGYHVYWFASDATVEQWEPIVRHRLVPFFKADRNATDLARILRVPGYYHLKNPAEPFMIKRVHRSGAKYTEAQMLAAWEPIEVQRPVRDHVVAHPAPRGDDFWSRVYSLNCADALTRLSGHPAVNGERFEFEPCRNGNLNIIADGKLTSCWIDTAGRIGSRTKGGPGVYQWIAWYGNSASETVRVIREVFPEVVADGR